MLQVKNGPTSPMKIKSIKKANEVPTGSTCSLEPGDGTDKPPC